MIYLHSEVRTADITDGTSYTYLAGEKYMDVDHYLDGLESCDSSTMYGGFGCDVNRWADLTLPPAQQDRAGYQPYYSFGSAPRRLWYGVLRWLGPDHQLLDHQHVHSCLANRKDGNPATPF